MAHRQHSLENTLFLVLAAASAAALWPNVARAQEPDRATRVGVYARGSVGFAGVASADDDVTVSGAGADLLLAGGVSVGQLVFFAEFFGARTFGVDVDFDGDTGSCDDCSLRLGSRFLPGLGVGYYTPTGFNYAVSLHAPGLTLEIEGEDFDSDRGAFVLFEAGKDWPVTDNLAAGVGLRLGAGSIDETGVALFSLAASFTFHR